MRHGGKGKCVKVKGKQIGNCALDRENNVRLKLSILVHGIYCFFEEEIVCHSTLGLNVTGSKPNKPVTRHLGGVN